jgi:hypothetical protein
MNILYILSLFLIITIITILIFNHFHNNNDNTKIFKGILYDGTPKTDFAKMIIEPKNYNNLFIYNENEEQYRNKSLYNGGGNANIRQYRVDIPEKKLIHNKNSGSALGIPTGKNGSGYSSLNDENKIIINSSIEQINKFLQLNKNTNIVYWSIDKNCNIGHSIYQVGDDVIKYITTKLKEVANKNNYLLNC